LSNYSTIKIPKTFRSGSNVQGCW